MISRRLLHFIFLWLCLSLKLEAEDAPLWQGHVWLLDGISVLPESAALKAQVARTHPVGRLFLECRADGLFALLRGDETQHQGKWSLSGVVLTLQRHDEKGAAMEQPLTYRIVEAAAERLVLSVVLPEGMPAVRLEFSPSQWPRR